jgi:ribosomal protein S18 acetylase RimI-like enzyme
MVSAVDALVRPALGRDEQQIANLLHFEPYVHRHLDWRAPLDWLGNPYFWVLEFNGRVLAALACPPDPKDVYWLRLFACAASFNLSQSWEMLWTTARQDIAATGRAAAIILHDWMKPLLRDSGFAQLQTVVMLEWTGRPSPDQTPPDGFSVRPMQAADLPGIAVLDTAAFTSIWRNSISGLEKAYSQAGYATVIEEAGRLVAYQITTQNPFSAHLARLAVHPHFMRRGLASALVCDLIAEVKRRNLNRITVNTQGDNRASLALYSRLGFYRTYENYPVYVCEM